MLNNFLQFSNKLNLRSIKINQNACSYLIQKNNWKKFRKRWLVKMIQRSK